MAASLSDEEFLRIQENLLDLKTKNFNLEETGRKQRSALGDATARVKVLEQELAKTQRTIDKSKKITEVHKVLQENENFQRKLYSQEEDFRVQNQTLMQELANLVISNEKLEGNIKDLKADSTNGEKREIVSESNDLHQSLEVLRQENLDLKAALEKQNELTRNLDLKENNEDGFKSISPELVEVSDTAVAFKKQGNHGNLAEKIEDLKIQLEGEQNETKLLKNHNDELRKHVKSFQEEVGTLKEKLKKKQGSFVQLQNELELSIDENKDALENLKKKHSSETDILNEKIQRLQTQVNNAQMALAEQKEKSTHEITSLNQQLLTTNAQLLEAPTEKLQELEATKICLQSEADVLKSKYQSEFEARVKMEKTASDTLDELNMTKGLLEQNQVALNEAQEQLSNLEKKSEKRKELLDEMAITLQQKTDEYRKSNEDMMEDHKNKVDGLEVIIKESQIKINDLEPWPAKYDDLSTQLVSVEEARKWLESELKNREDAISAMELKYKETILELKTEFCQEKGAIIDDHTSKLCDLQTQLELCNVQKCEFEENVKKLKQDIKDGIEDRKISEKKGHALVKDLKRQLQSEKKRNEKLQEKMKECLNETSSNISDPSRELEVDRSSISSWSLMSGNNDRETSTPAISPLPNSSTDQSPEEPSSVSIQQQENEVLMARLAIAQEQKWTLEERLSMLENSSSAMADDLVRKTALIQHYCMEKGDSGGRRTSMSPLTSDNKMRSMIDKIVHSESHAAGAHAKEVHRMQAMLEETLTKNMHLQQDLDHLSLEVVRLSKAAVPQKS